MACVPPCRTCPWRTDQDASEIPNFRLDLAESLISTTSTEFGAPLFACHQSRPGREVPCAGWLAVYGRDHMGVRMMMLEGRIDPEQLSPGEGWPDLEPDFESVIDKLRRTA